jgi:uncharacterized integral membrane protein
MRLVVSLMTVGLLIFVLGFVTTNYEAPVTVTVLQSQYSDVPLYAVVLIAMVIGIVYAGVIAVAEGAAIRFRNRRLMKEVERLERELAYVRTQPSSANRPEPDALLDSGSGPAAEMDVEDEEPEGLPPSSAPVYEGFGEESRDRDDDPYSGGRAV